MSLMSLTKLELQSIRSYLERYMYTISGLARPLTTTEHDEIGMLVQRLDVAVNESRPVIEKGRLVLSWRLPKEWAPSLNSYAFMKTWQRTNLRKELDSSLTRQIQDYSYAPLYGAKKKRWVRVTRFTTQPTDENGVDVLGGKMPLDALKRAEVLVDDNQEWCIREGLCRKTQRGNTHVLVEVFDVVTEGGIDPPPRDGVAPKPPPRKKRIIDE